MDLWYIEDCVEHAFDTLELLLKQWKEQPTNYHVGFRAVEDIDYATDELEFYLRSYRDELTQLELKYEQTIN